MLSLVGILEAANVTIAVTFTLVFFLRTRKQEKTGSWYILLLAAAIFALHELIGIGTVLNMVTVGGIYAGSEFLVILTLAFGFYWLYDVEQRRLRELDALHEAGKFLVSIHQVDELLPRVLQAIKSAVRAESLWIMLVDEQARELFLAAGSGMDEAAKKSLRFSVDAEPLAKVITSRQPFLVSDVQKHPDARRLPLSPASRSFFALPIVSREKCIGVLGLCRPYASKLGGYEQQFVATLISEAAVAIENAQLFSRMEDRMNEVASLHRVSAAVVSTLELNPLLQTILDQVMPLVGADVGVILLIDEEKLWPCWRQMDCTTEECPAYGSNELQCWTIEDTRCSIAFSTPHPDKGKLCTQCKAFQGARLQVRAARGLPDEILKNLQPTLGDGIGGRAVVEGKIVVDETSETNTWLGGELPAGQLRTQVSIPLKVKNRTVGLLNLGTLEQRKYSPDDVDLLTNVARQVAVALENAWLYEDAKGRAQELAALNSLARKLTLTPSENEVLSTVVEETAKTMSVDACLIAMVGRNGHLSIRASYGTSGEVLKSLEAQMPVGDKPAGSDVGDSARAGASRLKRDSKIALTQLIERLGLQSTVSVPLITKDRPVGYVIVYSDEPRYFKPAELDLLSTIAGQAAIAIENAHLYEETDARAHSFATLVQEMNHRIKNNLQAVASLLSLEMLEGSSESRQDSLRHSITRIRSIAAVHELLAPENAKLTDIRQLAERIGEMVKQTTLEPHEKVQLKVSGASVFLPSKQATAFALVLNELVSNAMEHAFNGQRNCTLTVSIEDLTPEVVVRVQDNGVGLPPEFDLDKCHSLGLQIAKTMVAKDLAGTLTLDDNYGTMATVRFCR